MWRKISFSVFLLTLIGLGLMSYRQMPATAQDGAIWSISYFNNGNLVAPATVLSSANSINFNWGNAAPATGIPADNFSARFGADPNIPVAGLYRFYVLADDGVSVSIDFGTPIINTFNSPLPNQLLSADIQLSAGVHHIQVDYREMIGPAFIYLTWQNTAVNSTPPNFAASASTNTSTTGSVQLGNWSAQYYNNSTFNGNPVLTRQEIAPGQNWGNGSPSTAIPIDNFSARWTGVETLAGGNYNIVVRADDAVRVFIDNVILINQFPAVPGQTYTASTTLSAGQHRIIIEYYESVGPAFLEYALVPISVTPSPTVPPPATAVPTLAPGTAQVDVTELNVRSEPRRSSPRRIIIRYGEIYPIIGRTGDSTWWQINADGVVGWVMARYVISSNVGAVPITDGTTGGAPAQASASFTLVTTVDVNFRNGPAVTAQFLGQIPAGTTLPIVGRNADSSWWQVTYNNTAVWIYGIYATLPANFDVNRIAITG